MCLHSQKLALRHVTAAYNVACNWAILPYRHIGHTGIQAIQAIQAYRAIQATTTICASLYSTSFGWVLAGLLSRCSNALHQCTCPTLRSSARYAGSKGTIADGRGAGDGVLGPTSRHLQRQACTQLLTTGNSQIPCVGLHAARKKTCGTKNTVSCSCARSGPELEGGSCPASGSIGSLT